MARNRQADLFKEDEQPDLFGAAPAPVYRPAPDRVRSRLEKILCEARAAETMPWMPTTLSLYREIFPRMSGYLPDDEALQFRMAFEAELKRFDAL